MATVYAATHSSGRRAAFKILHAVHRRNAEVCARFIEEYRLATSFEHPDSVRVYGVSTTDDGTPLLMMELLEGETLAARWRQQGRLPPVMASEIVIAILDQLAACHDAGIVHRDLKPENVFLTSDGRVRLLDFGTARGRSITTRRLAIGTPTYMPPEQARGQRDRVDARSDVFAVGALLWSLLSGLVLRRARNDDELLRQAATEPARALSLVAPDVPTKLAAIVDRALLQSPEDRWPNARAMREALLAVIAVLPGDDLDFAPLPSGDRPTLPSTPSSLRAVETVDFVK